MKAQMRMHSLALALAAAAVIPFVACGGKQSVASKSAAAFDDARKKGLPVGGGEHGGHGGEGAMPSDDTSMAGMDHSKMNMGGQKGMAGMDHSKMNMGGQKTMAGMDHSRMGGMQPGGMHMGTPTVEVKAVQAQRGQPGMTLSADPLDAPAPTAIADASRSAEMNEMMSSGEHGMAHGTYVQQDAGRDSVQSSSEEGPSLKHDMSGHTMAPAPAPQQQRTRTSPSPASPQSGGNSMRKTTPASSTSSTTYRCPMHPEVKSDRPGKCPKCGMALVKKEKK